MKYIKVFEQFLNEANELIKAQGLCRDAVFIVEKSVKSLMEDLKKADIAASYTTKVKPYNEGYMLEWKVKLTPETEKKVFQHYKELSPEVSKILTGFLSWAPSVWIQPSTWFEEDFAKEDKEGHARLEGSVFTLDNNEPHRRFPVKDRSDIGKATKEYAKICTDAVDTIKAMIPSIKKELDSLEA
jgi:hypothetical protein